MENTIDCTIEEAEEVLAEHYPGLEVTCQRELSFDFSYGASDYTYCQPGVIYALRDGKYHSSGFGNMMAGVIATDLAVRSLTDTHERPCNEWGIGPGKCGICKTPCNYERLHWWKGIGDICADCHRVKSAEYSNELSQQDYRDGQSRMVQGLMFGATCMLALAVAALFVWKATSGL